jgi:hypothetical protein
MVIKLESSGPKWTPDYCLALNGWFAANYALYKRVTPISQFGVDTDLLQRLNELIEEIDVRHYAETQFKPISVSYVRQLLNLTAIQNVRTAGAVPQLVSQGNITAAQTVNNFAISEYHRYAKSVNRSPGNGFVVDGINENLLTNNANFLSNLQAQSIQ